MTWKTDLFDVALKPFKRRSVYTIVLLWVFLVGTVCSNDRPAFLLSCCDATFKHTPGVTDGQRPAHGLPPQSGYSTGTSMDMDYGQGEMYDAYGRPERFGPSNPTVSWHWGFSFQSFLSIASSLHLSSSHLSRVLFLCPFCCSISVLSNFL